MENEITRNKAQELIVQLMYSFLILEETKVPINFEESIEEACNMPYADCDLYLKEVLIKSLKNQEKIRNKLDIGIIPRFTIRLGKPEIKYLGGYYYGIHAP